MAEAFHLPVYLFMRKPWIDLRKPEDSLKWYMNIFVPVDMSIFLGREPYFLSGWHRGLHVDKRLKTILSHENSPGKISNNWGLRILAVVVPKLSCQHYLLPFYFKSLFELLM